MLNNNYNGCLIKPETHLEYSNYMDIDNNRFYSDSSFSPALDQDDFELDDELDDVANYVQRNRGGRKQVKVGTTKRNARERNRVRFINNCFEVLREHIPFEMIDDKKNRKLSKVETLKYATLYIKQLGELLNSAVDDHQQPRKRLKSTDSMDAQKEAHPAGFNQSSSSGPISINNININIYDNRVSNMGPTSGSSIYTNEGYPYSPTTSTSSSSSSSYYNFSPKFEHYSEAGSYLYSSCGQPITHSPYGFVDSRFFNHGSVMH